MHRVSCAPCVSQPAQTASRPKTLQEWLIQALDALGAWQDRSGERRRLAALDERMLHDIGVDAACAATEAAKLFWRR